MDRAHDGLYIDYQDHEAALAKVAARLGVSGCSLDQLEYQADKVFHGRRRGIETSKRRGEERDELRKALLLCCESVEEVGHYGENGEDTRVCTHCGGAGPDGKPDEITHREHCPFGISRKLLPEKTIDELIEASSLGTPEAKAVRAQAPPEVTDKVMRLLQENERKKVAEFDSAKTQAIVLKAELRKHAIVSDDGGLTWLCLCCDGSWGSGGGEAHEPGCMVKLNFGTDVAEWDDGEKPIDISIRHPYLFLVWPAEDLPGEWIADCPGINAISQGGSPDEAFRSLMEVVAITVELDKRHDQDPGDRAFVLPEIQAMLDDIKTRELEADRQKAQLHLNVVPKKEDE